MPGIEVVRREVIGVDFGESGDPRRIATIVGQIPYWYADLGPNQFVPAESDPMPWRSRAGLAAWPEGEVEKEVAVIKPNRYFPDYAQLNAFVDELTDFERLLFPWLTVVPPWADELYRKGIWRVVVTHPDSLRRYAVGDLGVPCFCCCPVDRRLYSHWVVHDWDGRTGVLVSCKSKP